MKSLVVLFALVAVGLAAPSASTEKRSVVAYGVPSGQVVVSEPVVAVAPALYAGGSAVSHQSRVDVHSSPVVASYTPVVEQVVSGPAVVDARYAPVYSVPAAVSHQSRVDYKTSPVVYSAPSVYSPSVYSSPLYSPSVYSPSLYSPSVYSSSVYAPSVYPSYW